MMRRFFAGLALSALSIPAAPPGAKSFDAASIRPDNAGPGNSSGITTSPGLIRAENVTLNRCIIGAYGVTEAQIVGGPKWMSDLRYDIVARTGHPAGDAELMLMLQPLLADRFKLILHHETRTLSGYALTVTKGGIKATQSAPDVSASTDSSRGSIAATGSTLSHLAAKLSGALGGAPVIDLTGIPGAFDFVLKWTPDEMAVKTADSAGTQGPSLFTAIQDQLGLKLEARKVPVDVLVIDHAEPASAN